MGPFYEFVQFIFIIAGPGTLSLQIERTVQNALALAEWLEVRAQLEYMNNLELESSKYHILAKKYLKRGFGAILSF